VRPKQPWEQDEFSHTMQLPAWVTKWLVLGFNHHSLHHLFPKLPYYYSHALMFEAKHTQHWREWILKAKRMQASALIYHVR
jgi:fatty acid desaturase